MNFNALLINHNPKRFQPITTVVLEDNGTGEISSHLSFH
jgi:hypothetical protein